MTPENGLTTSERELVINKIPPGTWVFSGDDHFLWGQTVDGEEIYRYPKSRWVLVANVLGQRHHYTGWLAGKVAPMSPQEKQERQIEPPRFEPGQRSKKPLPKFPVLFPESIP